MHYSAQDIILTSLIEASSLGEEYNLKEDFFSPERREIYRIIKKIHKEKGAINHGLIEPIINAREEEIKDAYIKIVATTAVPYSTLANYVEQVKLASNIQSLKKILVDTLHQVESSVTTLEEENIFIATLQKKIEQIATYDKVSEDDTPQEKMRKMYNTYLGGGDVFISSGFESLDKKIQGFFNGSLVIIGARPSVGKTSLAISMAHNIAKEGYRVGFISIEMSDNQIQQRLASQMLEIPLKDIIVGSEKKRYKEKLQDFVENYNFPFFVDANPLSLATMKHRIKRMKNNYGLDIIFLDYLQLISGEFQRYELVTKISQELKVIARELDIPLVVLSQLSRGSEQTEEKIPNLSHLRESGSIEQDADMVILLYKNEQKKKNTDKGLIDVIPAVTLDIAKNRNGETGKIKLGFEKELARFVKY